MYDDPTDRTIYVLAVIPVLLFVISIWYDSASGAGGAKAKAGWRGARGPVACFSNNFNTLFCF
jgi:hypothetical protein